MNSLEIRTFLQPITFSFSVNMFVIYFCVIFLTTKTYIVQLGENLTFQQIGRQKILFILHVADVSRLVKNSPAVRQLTAVQGGKEATKAK